MNEKFIPYTISAEINANIVKGLGSNWNHSSEDLDQPTIPYSDLRDTLSKSNK